MAKEDYNLTVVSNRLDCQVRSHHISRNTHTLSFQSGLGSTAVDYVFIAYQIIRDVTMKPCRSTVCIRWLLDQQHQPHLKTV